MNKKALVLTLIFALLFSAVAGNQFINSTTAQNYTEIIIKYDGSVDPVGAPIQRDGDIYTLTGNANAITVRRNNMTLDGTGHTLSSTLTVTNANNVTIKNFIITINSYFEEDILLTNCSSITVSSNILTGSPPERESRVLSSGIVVWGGTSNVITGNLIIGNSKGISFESTTSNNRVFGNNITGNSRGLWIYSSENNSIFNNSFDKNAVNVFITGETVIRWGETVVLPLMNTFNNGTTGNYWSNYNGTDNNGDGIGDIPYIIDENNRDNHPLMMPYEFSLTLSLSPSPEPALETKPFPVVPIAAVSVVAVALVVAGLLVYHKKHKHHLVKEV
jgi:parallel beta-helix repeat protein